MTVRGEVRPRKRTVIFRPDRRTRVVVDVVKVTMDGIVVQRPAVRDAVISRLGRRPLGDTGYTRRRRGIRSLSDSSTWTDDTHVEVHSAGLLTFVVDAVRGFLRAQIMHGLSGRRTAMRRWIDGKGSTGGGFCTTERERETTKRRQKETTERATVSSEPFKGKSVYSSKCTQEAAAVSMAFAGSYCTPSLHAVWV